MPCLPIQFLNLLIRIAGSLSEISIGNPLTLKIQVDWKTMVIKQSIFSVHMKLFPLNTRVKSSSPRRLYATQTQKSYFTLWLLKLPQRPEFRKKLKQLNGKLGTKKDLVHLRWPGFFAPMMNTRCGMIISWPQTDNWGVPGTSHLSSSGVTFYV